MDLITYNAHMKCAHDAIEAKQPSMARVSITRALSILLSTFDAEVPSTTSDFLKHFDDFQLLANSATSLDDPSLNDCVNVGRFLFSVIFQLANERASDQSAQVRINDLEGTVQSLRLELSIYNSICSDAEILSKRLHAREFDEYENFIKTHIPKRSDSLVFKKPSLNDLSSFIKVFGKLFESGLTFARKFDALQRQNVSLINELSQLQKNPINSGKKSRKGKIVEYVPKKVLDTLDKKHERALRDIEDLKLQVAHKKSYSRKVLTVKSEDESIPEFTMLLINQPTPCRTNAMNIKTITGLPFTIAVTDNLGITMDVQFSIWGTPIYPESIPFAKHWPLAMNVEIVNFFKSILKDSKEQRLRTIYRALEDLKRISVDDILEVDDLSERTKRAVSLSGCESLWAMASLSDYAFTSRVINASMTDGSGVQFSMEEAQDSHIEILSYIQDCAMILAENRSFNF